MQVVNITKTSWIFDSRPFAGTDAVSAIVINEQTQAKTVTAITYTYADNKLSFTNDFGLTLEDELLFILKIGANAQGEGGRILSKEKVFVTDQNTQDYNYTESDYITAESGDNEFIVVE